MGVLRGTGSSRQWICRLLVVFSECRRCLHLFCLQGRWFAGGLRVVVVDVWEEEEAQGGGEENWDAASDRVGWPIAREIKRAESE